MSPESAQDSFRSQGRETYLPGRTVIVTVRLPKLSKSMSNLSFGARESVVPTMVPVPLKIVNVPAVPTRKGDPPRPPNRPTSNMIGSPDSGTTSGGPVTGCDTRPLASVVPSESPQVPVADTETVIPGGSGTCTSSTSCHPCVAETDLTTVVVPPSGGAGVGVGDGVGVGVGDAVVVWDGVVGKRSVQATMPSTVSDVVRTRSVL